MSEEREAGQRTEHRPRGIWRKKEAGPGEMAFMRAGSSSYFPHISPKTHSHSAFCQAILMHKDNHQYTEPQSPS